MDIEVRFAVEKDIPRIITLLEQVAEIHNNARPDLFRAGSKKYDKADLCKLLRDKKTVIFVATDGNDTVLGYIFCMLNEYKNHNIMQDNRTLYIDDLCVDADKRGLNIGRVLFHHAREFAKTQGCYNITLNVWTGNDNARFFYEKLGMREQKRTLELLL